jgi:hypothetical protein
MPHFDVDGTAQVNTAGILLQNLAHSALKLNYVQKRKLLFSRARKKQKKEGERARTREVNKQMREREKLLIDSWVRCSQ